MNRKIRKALRYLRCRKNAGDKKLRACFHQKGAACIEVHDIIQNGNEAFAAASEDPYFVFRLTSPSDKLTVRAELSSEANGSAALYYSYDFKRFSEEQRIILNGRRALNLSFPKKVKWLRFDPVDCVGAFHLHHFSLESGEIVGADFLPVDIDFISRAFHKLDRLFEEDGKKPEDMIVFVTHELSDTGAPLLCRKMCGAVKQQGLGSVLLTLSKRKDAVDIGEFERSADALFLCDGEKEVNRAIEGLSSRGISRIILNTVVTGHLAPALKKKGFQVVSLVHEMKDSCTILNAQPKMKALAEYADTIVFPNQYVLNDFSSVENEIHAHCIIRPQGYYKKSILRGTSERKAALVRRLNLPADALLIAGVGAVNFGKGVDLLPLIARELERKGENPHFVWLGSTNMYSYEVWLKSQIHKMGLDSRFHFVGFLRDDEEYLEYLCGCDVFALVSREDSMPSAMIESMSCGLPVVAFKQSGGAQTALADDRGFLVDFMDLPTFAEALLEAGNRRGNTADMIMRAEQYVEETLNFTEYVSFIVGLVQ